ncbi:DUF1801 domain-containing protein [Catalinimonas sp. 4WD22]|uniref:DUF1801 domain-containing protein n=1 Tax=Catalinimonas locisalis TaxID=3133978 RepID=UPI003100D87C
MRKLRMSFLVYDEVEPPKIFILKSDSVKESLKKPLFDDNASKHKLIFKYHYPMPSQSLNNPPVKNIQLKSSPEVEAVFNNYPDVVREKMLKLRKLVLSTAEETEGITQVEECLKWGEPSYVVKKGSTLRMDWKPKTPEQYALYFKCTSKLVSTFKKVYQDLFRYEGNRAIVFQQNDTLPEEALKKCIRAALTYHRVKQLPNLGLA